MRVLCLVLAMLAARAHAHEPQPSAAWFVQSELWTPGDETEPARQASYVLRLADDRFVLELGAVRVLGVRAPASLTAWHTHDPTTVFRAEADDLAGLVRRHLPPVWSTPLARWLSDDADAYPLVGHAWPEPPFETSGESPGVTHRESGAVRVRSPDEFPALEEVNERAYETITTEREGGPTTLRQIYLAIVPGDPADWDIDAAGREPVTSVRALRPRPAPIQPGDRVGGLRLFGRSGAAVDIRRAFEPERTPRSERRASALLLVFEHASEAAPAQPARLDAIASARERLAVNAARTEVRRPLLIARPVAVFDVPDYSRGALEAFAGRWSDLGSEPLLASVDSELPAVLWTHPPRESIDLFAPGAGAAAALMDPEGRLIAVLRLDDADADLADWVVRTLSTGPITADGP